MPIRSGGPPREPSEIKEDQRQAVHPEEKRGTYADTVTPADISDPQELIARAEALSLELGTAITPGFEALVFKASRGIFSTRPPNGNRYAQHFDGRRWRPAMF